MSAEAAVRASGLLVRGRPVVVLLSGGRDSVCLLDLAARLSGAVTALHVDFGLRPGSEEDAEHCAALCRRLGVPFELRRAGAPGANVQAWAREVRYREAGALARALRADVATGHTATDQVETVLYRLAASPGRRALLGMPARDGRLVRPLLGATRAQTAAHCAQRGLPWCEDPSNAGDRYARGRVRHGLLPALEAIHPGAAGNVLRTMELLRDEAEVLDAATAAALDAAGAPPRLDALRALAPALRRLALQLAADRDTGGSAPPVGHRADEILALRPGQMLDLGQGLRVRVARPGGGVRFEGATPRGPHPVNRDE